jgi:hypothetical protein
MVFQMAQTDGSFDVFLCAAKITCRSIPLPTNADGPLPHFHLSAGSRQPTPTRASPTA